MIKLKIKTWSVNLTGRQGKVRFGVFSFKFVTLEILFYVHVTHGFFLKFVRETRSRLYLYCPCTWDQLLHLWEGGGGVRRVSLSSVRGEGHCYLLWCVMLKLSRLSLSMSDKQSRPKTISKESVWYGHFIGDATAGLVA